MSISSTANRVGAAAQRSPESAAPGLDQHATWFAVAAAPRFAIPILLVAGAVIFAVNLGNYPIYTKGESREAVTVLDIAHGSGWILPMRAGIEIPSKPLMMHWLGALASLAAGGVTEWTVRLPSAVLAIGAILLCYLYVRSLFDEASALLSALMLGTSIQFMQAGSGARVDMTLTFFLEIAFFEFIMIAEGCSRRWLVLYLALAAAILSKGPVGLVLPAIAALIWIGLERRWSVLRKLHIVEGVVIVTVLAGGWYFAATEIAGADFVRKQIFAENFQRFLGGPGFHEGHGHPFYYVELALLAGFMPWTVLLPAPAARLTRGARSLSPRLRFLLAWLFTVLIFYNLATSKRGVYLLALYPALASLIAVSIGGKLLFERGRLLWMRALGLSAGLLFVAAGLAGWSALAALEIDPAALGGALAHFNVTAPAFMPALRRSVGGHWIIATLIPLAVVAVGVGLIATRSKIEATVSLIAAGAGCLALAANLFVLPAIANALALKNFTAAAMTVVGDRPVAYLEGLDYAVAFYSGRTIPIVHLRDPKPPDYLLCWRETYDRIGPPLRDSLSEVLASGPTELDGSGGFVLLKRKPAEATDRRG